ncbi:phosphatase PAP2 family protein [Motilibacter deserti]|uniref:Inositol phosphorylceramide synthase n=1 Tax=Motilibacter deserti TaxID=2714956 RepID=A0ABX0GQ92_9ACTN|nr:inositol phosphorylceramide synthase [Motilibacter deserti]
MTAVVGAVRGAGRRVPQGARELLLVAVLLAVYKFGRLLSAESVATAKQNAYAILHLEKALRLPQEAWAQSLALGSPDLVQLANRYYAWVHFPAAAAMLLGLWFFARPNYFWIRRVMATMTMVALVLHVVLPLAPPRMLPGFVDTGLYYNESVYSSPTAAALANQYAAMPSLHVGWAIIVAAAVIATFGSRWRYLVLAHPAITLVVVVVTANHYWLDALVAAALFAVSFALVGPRGVLVRRKADYAVAA